MFDRRLPTQPSQRRYAKLRIRLEIDVRQAGVDSAAYLNNAEFRNIVAAQIKEIADQIIKDKNLELAQAGETTFTAGTILVETVWTVVGVEDIMRALTEPPTIFRDYERRLARNLAARLKDINDFVVVALIGVQAREQNYPGWATTAWDLEPYMPWILSFAVAGLALWLYFQVLRPPPPSTVDGSTVHQALRKIERDLQAISDRLPPRGSSCDLRGACNPDCYGTAARVPPKGACR
jgi:hypothetical protein